MYIILESGNLLSDMTVTFLKKNGDEIHTNVLLGFVDDMGHANIFVKDITKTVKEQEELSKRLDYDSQTNLLTKDAFLNRVSSHVKKNSEGYLFFIDFDDFKSINEKYGHAGGDFALVSIAEKLQEPLLSIPGSYLGRYGGDEFIAYVPLDSYDDIDDILSYMTTPLPFNYDSLGERDITTSIGVRKYTSLKSLEDNIKDANKILFEIKRTTKNGFLFYEDFFDN